MDTCIFCRIIAGRIAGKMIYEDESVVAIEDVNPQAPIHLLVLPREHLASLQEAAEGHVPMLGRLLTVAAQLARQLGSKDFRTVINTGALAGQSVFHLHVHVLGGRVFHWPPG